MIARGLSGSLCLWVLFAATALGSGTPPDKWQQVLLAGSQARELGALDDSIAALELAVREAPDAPSRVLSQTQLGVSLSQTGRLAQADAALQSAYRDADADNRYAVALAIGNLAVRSGDSSRARRYYQEAVQSAPADPAGNDTRVIAELALTSLLQPPDRPAKLEQLLPRVEAMGVPSYRARALFGLGQQASEALVLAQLTHSPGLDRALRLSYRGLAASKEWADQNGDLPLAVDAADALAQLYESQGRYEDAAQINREAIRAAARLKHGQSELPLARLEWRAARLAMRRGDAAAALASYLRAASDLQAIASDLPIEDARGQSTYQTLQRPIFTGLADELLQGVDALAPEAQQQRLTAALDLAEQAHQAELQDYLGDRCSVDSVDKSSGAAGDSLAPGIAIIYPLVLKERLEVIVRTRQGLLHHATPIPAALLAREIQGFRAALLDPGSSDYLPASKRLEQWLIAPFASALEQAHAQQLIIVPDGYLRLIPFAALHDGNQFLAQRYWLSTVTGLAMTEQHSQRRARPVSLFAGLSTPGPVVERLAAMGFAAGTLPGSEAGSVAATRALNLRSQLALPGVQTEIQDLVPLSRSAWMLNDQFTVSRFAREVQSGRYTVVHIASHSFFGASAGDSFLLAYDNVIHIDELQQLLASSKVQQSGIDLLTLSACDTATGDDRAPLGFAGAAIKAHARSVLGSLWAVSDTATQQFMAVFYKGLPQRGKAEAFTEAQRALIGSGAFSHPYYWAPFVLTGDWN
jgi:CHAT domain-containing protein